jgi:hypothetical protein
MKLTGSPGRMHAQALKYQLLSRPIESWGRALRYCLIVVVNTVVPAETAWRLTRSR